MFGELGKSSRYLGQAAKMMVGVPDYDNYVAHMQKRTDQTPMTYEEFLKSAKMHVTVVKVGLSAVRP